MLATYMRRMRINNLEIRIAGDKEAILISRLLFRMRRMYVASIRLDFTALDGMHRTQFDHTC